VRPVELRYYLVASHYRSVVEFSFEALEEAGAAYRRIEGFVRRGDEVLGGTGDRAGVACAEFAEAMDDDLSLPAALAALQGVLREGNKLLADGPSDALRGTVLSVRSMLDVLGLDPLAGPWAGGGEVSAGLREVVDGLVAVSLEERAAARSRKDFDAADRIRDGLLAAGVLVEDTPAGPRWTLEEKD